MLAAAMTACEAGEDDESERFRGRCEQIFACDCAEYRHADVDACMRDEAARRAGWIAQFTAAGLTVDEACMDRAQAPDPDACLTFEAYELLHPELPPRCGGCSFASGERQVGEPCVEFDWFGNVTDCAPGLACVGRTSSGVCLDPCEPSAQGLPCDDEVVCPAGLYCDGDGVCSPAARLGETCGLRQCAEDLTCDRDSERCVQLAGPGESCAEVYCAGEGLVCAVGDVCRPAPQLGEPCRDWQCPDGLVCHVHSQVCVPVGEVGESCAGDHHCAVGLYCEGERCLPGRGPGEPCADISAPCRLDLSCIDGVCEPGQGRVCKTP